MLIRRCAWHQGYRGYPIVFGIASWRGLGVSFTDGMCVGCTARFREEWRLPEPETRRLPSRWAGGPARVAVVVLVAVSFTLASRPLDEAGSRGTATVPPETVLVPPVPVEEEPPPAQAVTNRPRRTRTVASRPQPAEVSRPPVPAPAISREPSDSFAAPPPAVTPEVPVVTVSVSTPARTPVRRASPPAASSPVDVAFASVPHAGLVHQAP